MEVGSVPFNCNSSWIRLLFSPEPYKSEVIPNLVRSIYNTYDLKSLKESADISPGSPPKTSDNINTDIA